MKIIRYSTLLLLFATQCIFAQTQDFQTLPIDSALVWLNNNHVDNPATFHDRALQTLARAYQLEDDQIKGEVHQVLMRWHAYHVLFTIDSIFHHGEKAIALFKQTKDQRNLAATNAELAIEYIDENELKRSEELIFESIAIYESLGDEKGLGQSYRRLSSIFRAQDEPELSIKYALQALPITEKAKDYYTMALAWMGLILSYHETRELDKAIEAGNNCIATVNDFVPEEVFILARAYAYRGDVWSDLGEYQKSLEDNQKSYAIIEQKIGAQRPAAKTYRQGIGRAYYMQGKYKEALPHLEASVEGYKGLGQGGKPKMRDFLELIGDCYFQLGDYQKAYKSQQAALVIFDTLMQNKIANLESEALIKYETGKKDQALAEQETVIAQNSRIQWLGAGLIGLLLLFLGTLFYYYQRNKKTAQALRAKNQENELLLKEIHHRVKNNLQTISSLLNLQSASISDQSALDAVQESKNRVASMALIHQKLYQGENLAAIEMRDYFETIGKAIKDSFGEKAAHVTLEVNMPEIELDVDTAIPIGLITNELITNSLKHAFPEKKNGKISINLRQKEDGLLQLHIADDGKGTVEVQNSNKEKGFGTLLIQLLTTQLDGTLQKTNEAGTSTVIQFPRQEKSAA